MSDARWYDDQSKPILWRAWYVIDNAVATYDGASGEEFRALPGDGMQAVVLAFPDATRRMIIGNDWYWVDDGPSGPIYGQGFSPEYSNAADIIARYPTAAVKRGRFTDDATIMKIQRDMDNFEPYAIEITAG